MNNGFKKYIVASSILIGTCIGAGVLGIPYVASRAGLVATMFYILAIGFIIYLVNLYLGEVTLRTKGKDHQLIGYVEEYLGKRGRHVVEFALIFGIYAALIAYMNGMGQSLSWIFTGGADYYIQFGVGVGIVMAGLIFGGIKSLKKFERIGVFIILGLLLVIIAMIFPKVSSSNLSVVDFDNILLPFGVVLFALMSFQSIPQIKMVLGRDVKYFKRVIGTGSIVSVLFYMLFTFVVVGYKGINTPEVATLALGPVFIFLGIFTMFTSYLASGNALKESFEFDERMGGVVSWILSAIVPIGLFLLTQMSDFFSFTKILSIGGVVSGGTLAVMILLTFVASKKKKIKVAYESKKRMWLIILLILIFVFGVVRELVSF